MTAGWAANHFASVIVLLREELDLSALLVNGAYGIYALGLLPCLLLGGAAADRFGGRPVVMTGSTIALAGNLSLMLFHGPVGLLGGRLIVGLGVGLVVSPGTAWAARLRGASGATVAGIALTSGFAIGPVVSGAVATLDAPIWLPFALSIAASAAAIAFSATTGDVPNAVTGPQEGTPAPLEPGASAGKALATAVPVAMWVFAAIISSVIVLASRVAEYFSTGVFLPGVAAVFGFGTGMLVQALGRSFSWGPFSGVAGIVLAMSGFLLVATGGTDPSLPRFFVATILLGAAYGLCLRDGLLDVNAYAPPAYRGRVLGAYYAATYIGFGLPPLLEVLEPHTGPSLPFYVLAGGAAAAAVLRTWQIRSGYLARA
ncbi:Major Facilitator Superfamily protein [Corynebacterium timonense]|uniref:Major Facilitator Superfamily protein n=2 Tax=Corynebacterium timonense TaxID=441500 RepID=A0A1H1RJD7_9CORY|nr:Major Facilitator Superfamily protein [Corynebacterium timonense]